ncbi:MAG: transcriptional regulator PpsR [Pseudomonadota bacterium]
MTQHRRFRDAAAHLGPLDDDVTGDILSAAADLVLVVDPKGIINDQSVADADLARDDRVSWIGQAWSDVVTPESQPKIEAIISEAQREGVSRPREINHTIVGDDDLPMRYVAIRLGDTGRVMAFGRDLRSVARMQQRLVNAQMAMERDFARLRQAEARYRLLFQMASEPVLIIDAATQAVSEANPSACNLVDLAAPKLLGRRLVQVFDPASRDSVRAQLAAASAVGQATPFQARLANGREVNLAVSLFRQTDQAFLLVRMSSDSAQLLVRGGADRESRAVLDVIDALPDGFVLLDDNRQIIDANSAFLDLIQIASIDQARGQSLEKWFERPGVDFNVLMSNLREHGSVRRFPTILRGDLGSLENVEIAAVSVTGTNEGFVGLVVRSVGAAARPNILVDGFPARSVDQLSELVGHMSLKDVVRETTDVVERLCIEAALKLTSDNRASAAQMLGLSRQSLYAKLRRFGMVESNNAN